jgi:hypothetical protein
VASRTIFALLLALLGALFRRSLITAGSSVISDTLIDLFLNLNMLKLLAIQHV